MTAGRVSIIPLLAWACLAVPAVAEPHDLLATLENTDGTRVTGRLAAVSPTEVTLADGAALAVAAIRRIVVAGPADRGPVVVEGVDGGTLTGDDFSCGDGVATIRSPAGRIELPAGRVRSVTLRRPRADVATAAADWRAALPEAPETDLIVVGKEEGNAERLDVVECAIATVTADTVTVVLDEERIPVKRAKVVGLWFLRPPVAAGGIRVEVGGGSLAARSVSWSPQELLVDEAVRLPAASLRAIDYAAGRTVRLGTLVPERSESEPFFGGLARLEGLGPAFAPRFIAGGGAETLVMRPRSQVVWRVPADARRFRSAVAAEPGKRPAGTSVLVLLDDREAFRCRLDDAAAQPIDLDVSGGRRLSIQIDFPAAGGLGCPLRFTDPVFEQ